MSGERKRIDAAAGGTAAIVVIIELVLNQLGELPPITIDPAYILAPFSVAALARWFSAKPQPTVSPAEEQQKDDNT